MVEGQAIFGLAGVPLILALVEVIKRAVELPPRYWPLLAVLIGVALNVLVGIAGLQTTLFSASLTGLIAGLAASGLYSAGKELQQARQPDDEANQNA